MTRSPIELLWTAKNKKLVLFTSMYIYKTGPTETQRAKYTKYVKVSRNVSNKFKRTGRKFNQKLC